MKNKLSFKHKLILLGYIGIIGAFTAPAFAEREAKMYAITTWDGGACTGGTRDSWDNMALAWYDEITDTGTSVFGWCVWGHCGDAYSRSGYRINGSIKDIYFTDVSIAANGEDHKRIDTADAALGAWHGSESGNVYQGSMRVTGNDCKIKQTEMKLGNTDLEFLHLSSCQSMDDNQWSTWWKALAGVHQVDGFHGWMWISSGRADDYEDFADDAFDTSIANAWLDNLYDPDVVDKNGNHYDQCPVAYVVGNSSAEISDRLNHERYDSLYPSAAPIKKWAATYITGCDPAAETVITSDFSS